MGGGERTTHRLVQISTLVHTLVCFCCVRFRRPFEEHAANTQVQTPPHISPTAPSPSPFFQNLFQHSCRFHPLPPFFPFQLRQPVFGHTCAQSKSLMQLMGNDLSDCGTKTCVEGGKRGGGGGSIDEWAM